MACVTIQTTCTNRNISLNIFSGGAKKKHMYKPDQPHYSVTHDYKVWSTDIPVYLLTMTTVPQ